MVRSKEILKISRELYSKFDFCMLKIHVKCHHNMKIRAIAVNINTVEQFLVQLSGLVIVIGFEGLYVI